MASAPVAKEPTPRMAPAPNLSSNLPMMGEMTTATRPPRLTAPENMPTDQPMDWVMGTTNTEMVATAMTVRADRLTATPLPAITHP